MTTPPTATAIQNLIATRASAFQRVIRPGEDYIPPSGKVLEADDLEMLLEASCDLWLTAGRFAVDFERDFAIYMEQKFCLLVNSGSSANLVAFSTLTSPALGDRQIRPGDEVITVAAGFPTTVNPIVQAGCIPVFVDIQLGDLGVAVGELEKAVSPKTKAVMMAHALGNPFDARAVREFCDRHGLWFVEDCCDAVGARLHGRLVGQFSDLCTVSFYPAHHMTMGEGGAVLTSNPRLKKIAESFRDWGRDCWCPPGRDNTCRKRFNWRFAELPEGYDHKYVYSHVGYNLKVTDMQAAIGCSQLRKLPRFIERRNRNHAYLADRLRRRVPNFDERMQIVSPLPGAEPSWFGFAINLKEDVRARMVRHLEASKIGTRLFFAGNLTKQPLYQDREYRTVGPLAQTDLAMSRTFWVGIFPALDETHMDYIADKIAEFWT